MVSPLPVLKQIQCPNCGTNLNQRMYNTQTLVCPSCNSHVTFGGASGQEVSPGIRLPDAPVPIHPGDKATFDGMEYFVLGRVIYQGWDPEEPSDKWTWHEWLLGGKTGRLVWLSYSPDEGFLLSSKVRIKLPFDPRFGTTIPVDEKTNFWVKERYPARVFGAEGELTWQAKRGDQLLMVEGMSSGANYSVQFTEEELEMYRAKQVKPEELAQAFGKPEWLRQLKRQTEMKGGYRIAAMIAILMACVGFAFAAFAATTGEKVIDQKLTLSSAAETPSVIPVTFSQTGRPAVISLEVLTSLPANSVITPEIDVSIVDPDGKRTDLTTQEFWHETGFDDEGSWTDKRAKGSKHFVPNKEGTHQLEISLEDSPYSTIDVQVQVKRNEILYTWFGCYGILAALLGGGLFVLGAPKFTAGAASGLLEMIGDDD